MSVTTGPRAPGPTAPGPTAPGLLQPAIPVWGLFGRCLLISIGELLIVPFPWTIAIFYRFMCRHVTLPDGKRLEFTGRGEEIWYVMLLPALGWAFMAYMVPVLVASEDPAALMQGPLSDLVDVFNIVLFILVSVLAIAVFRWFCTHVKSQDGALSLGFQGGFLAFIGWYILFVLSFLTIIGWAWVLKFWVRWFCRNVQGTLAFDFVGSGFSVLWRVVVAYLVCIFIIPIPWMLRWLTSWFISQVSVQPGHAA